MERQRERQPICLGDDSPMLGIYSIRREGAVEWRSEGASGLGGSQNSIIAAPTGSGGGRDRDRRDEAPEKIRGRGGERKERDGGRDKAEKKVGKQSGGGEGWKGGRMRLNIMER